MRINAGSKLTADDVHQAAKIARGHGHDIHIEEMAVGSRGAITFYGESYSGNRRSGRQGRSDAYAATWTAWGWLIAELFRRDPEAKIGQYKGVEDFRNWCREEHERWRKHRSNRPNDPGADISFLELVEEVTA